MGVLKHCCCGARGLLITFSVLGAVLLVIGLAAKPAIDALLRSQVASTVNMESNSSALFDVWTGKTVVPEYMTFYVFNITNVDAVLHKAARPQFKMIGPFTYYEYNHKFDLNWNDDQTRVYYHYSRIFVPHDTPCPEGTSTDTLEPPYCTLDHNTPVTVGNLALLGFAEKLIGQLPGQEKLVGDLVDLIIELIEAKHPGLEQPIITVPAKDIIWGYNDTIIKNFDGILEFVAALIKNITGKEIDPPLQSPVIRLQFNDSATIRVNYSSIHTGKGDSKRAFSYEEWAGYEGSLNFWTGCDSPSGYRAQGNMLNGTEGLQFHPLISQDDILPVYSQDLLRSANLYYTGPFAVKGIDLYRFRITPETLLSQYDYPANCAFNNTAPSGTMNLADVQGAPIFASKPYFLDANATYRELVDLTGLPTPDPDRHDTFLDIEPWTGATMHAHQRLQINAHFQQRDFIRHFRNLSKPGFYLPIAWADEWAYISDDLADQWKSEVGLALNLAHYAHVVGLSVGLSLMGLCAAIAVVREVRARRRAKAEGKKEVDERSALLVNEDVVI